MTPPSAALAAFQSSGCFPSARGNAMPQNGRRLDNGSRGFAHGRRIDPALDPNSESSFRNIFRMKQSSPVIRWHSVTGAWKQHLKPPLSHLFGRPASVPTISGFPYTRNHRYLKGSYASPWELRASQRKSPTVGPGAGGCYLLTNARREGRSCNTRPPLAVVLVGDWSISCALWL
jgi:hypothetical protein